MLTKKVQKLFSNKAWFFNFRDYIIIGGGSAGSVVANRLSKDFNTILFEYGKSDRGHWDSWKI